MRSFDRLRGRARSRRKFRIAAGRTCFLTRQFLFFFFQGSIDRQLCVNQAPDETRRIVGRWITITRGTRPAWRTSLWRKWSRTRTSRSISNPPLPPRPYSTAICWPISESRPSPPPYWPVVCQRRPFFCDLSFSRMKLINFASGWVFRVASRENNNGNNYYRIATLMLTGGPESGSMFVVRENPLHGFEKKENVSRDWKKEKKKVSSKRARSPRTKRTLERMRVPLIRKIPFVL